MMNRIKPDPLSLGVSSKHIRAMHVNEEVFKSSFIVAINIRLLFVYIATKD